MSGARIIKAIEEAARGDFSRVTTHGHVWIRDGADKAEAWDAISKKNAEIEQLRERVAEMQAEAGMYHSLYDVATERLASARKALKMFVQRVERYGNWDDGCFYYGATSASELQEPLALAKAELEQGQK